MRKLALPPQLNRRWALVVLGKIDGDSRLGGTAPERARFEVCRTGEISVRGAGRAVLEAGEPEVFRWGYHRGKVENWYRRLEAP